MSNRLRKIYLTITIMISIFFVYLTVFKFTNSYLRLWESLVDLWSSVRIYFAFIFNRKTSAVPTVVEWSKVIKQENNPAGRSKRVYRAKQGVFCVTF